MQLLFFLNFILFIFLYSRFLLVIHLYILVYTRPSQSPSSSHHHPPPPPLSPLGVHTFVLYICVSISALCNCCLGFVFILDLIYTNTGEFLLQTVSGQICSLYKLWHKLFQTIKVNFFSWVIYDVFVFWKCSCNSQMYPWEYLNYDGRIFPIYSWESQHLSNIFFKHNTI